MIWGSIFLLDVWGEVGGWYDFWKVMIYYENMSLCVCWKNVILFLKSSVGFFKDLMLLFIDVWYFFLLRKVFLVMCFIMVFNRFSIWGWLGDIVFYWICGVVDYDSGLFLKLFGLVFW